MYNKKNIIVMFLFVMLSFAIISEVSAASNAEADGVGVEPPVYSTNLTNHDAADDNSNFVQDHDDNIDDLKTHNGQNSFNNTPNGVKENLYEHDGDKDEPDDLPISHGLNDDGKYFDGNPMDFNGSFDRLKESMPNNPIKSRDNNFTAVPQGEAMNDVISDLIGLNNISPNFKNGDKTKSPENMTQNPMDKNTNQVPQKPDNNKSPIKELAKMKNPKKFKKVKKVKKSKKHKKTKKRFPKKAKKGRLIKL